VRAGTGRAGPRTEHHHGVLQLLGRPVARGGTALGGWIDRLPVALLLAAPAAILAAISLAIPEAVRLGFTIDLEIYRRDGTALLSGLAPYRDVAVEYPPLAIGAMVLPLLGSPAPMDLPTYTSRFVAIAAVLVAATGWLTWRATRSRRAVALWGALVVVSWVSAIFRYDLWPTLALLAGVVLATAHPAVGGLALGVGTMLKVFPAAVLPVVAAALLVRGARTRAAPARLLGAFALVVGGVLAAAWVIAGPESLDWLRYQGERGLQLESLGATVLLVAHAVAGLPLERNFDYGAVQIVGAGSTEIVAISPWLQAPLLAGVLAVAVRRFRWDVSRQGAVPLRSLAIAAVAALAVPLLGSKVLSMQYVLWLLPLIPLIGARFAAPALLLAWLTTLVYTGVYEALYHFEAGAIALLLARNLLLVGFAADVLGELSARRDIAAPDLALATPAVAEPSRAS
jgi:hypothetical protein